MHKQNTNVNGFTIVELLIVIVVIAILATISILAYNDIQDRVIASTVKSDLANFAKKIEIAKVDSSNDGYPAPPTAAMGIRVSKSVYKGGRNNWYYCVSPDYASYALGVIDEKGRSYSQSSANGLEDIVPPEYVDGTNTCAKVGNSGFAHTGYSWNGTTGTWQGWAN